MKAETLPPPIRDDDYDRSIHSNPDAKAWADFFNETLVKRGLQPFDPDLMHVWFANAMMAMHDSQYSKLKVEATRQVRSILFEAKLQLDANRTELQILRAKAETVDAFSRALRGRDEQGQMSVSVSWQIQQCLDALEREEAA